MCGAVTAGMGENPLDVTNMLIVITDDSCAFFKRHRILWNVLFRFTTIRLLTNIIRRIFGITYCTRQWLIPVEGACPANGISYIHGFAFVQWNIMDFLK